MKVINFSDDIRNTINKIFYPLELQSLNDLELYDELFKQKIDILEQNEKIYKQIVSIAFLDQYKIYNHYIMKNDAEREEIELIEFYDENISSLADVISYVEEDYTSLIDMI